MLRDEIKKENPDLEIIINGGITKVDEINNHLNFLFHKVDYDILLKRRDWFNCGINYC